MIYLRRDLKMDPNRLLGDEDYDDGQIHELVPGSLLDNAIRNEPWLNHSDRYRRRWLHLMNSRPVVFIGTVMSRPRRLFEVTVVLQMDDRRWNCQTIIRLHDFDRFTGPDPA